MKRNSLTIAKGVQAILFTTAFLFTTHVLFAQKIKVGNIGIRAGASIANWHYNEAGNSDLNLKPRISLEAAVFTNIMLSESFSVQPELGFASFGSKASDEIDAIEYKLKYITIPVLVKYKLPVGVSFFAGPQVGVLLSSKAEMLGHESDVKSMFGKTDLMLTGGVEYNFFKGLSAGVRYTRGFANMYKGGGDVKLRNYSFGLNVCYRLDFSALKF